LQAREEGIGYTLDEMEGGKKLKFTFQDFDFKKVKKKLEVEMETDDE